VIRVVPVGQTISSFDRIASLIETCKHKGVDPHAYLTDVISKT
jgi:hypothetical protein